SDIVRHYGNWMTDLHGIAVANTSPEMSTVYIRCKVHKGLFDTEYYVLVNHSSAYYVSRQDVKVPKQPQGEQSVNGQVLGYLIAKKKGKSLVQFPGEAVIGGLRTWVENTALVTA